MSSGRRAQPLTGRPSTHSSWRVGPSLSTRSSHWLDPSLLGSIPRPLALRTKQGSGSGSWWFAWRLPARLLPVDLGSGRVQAVEATGGLHPTRGWPRSRKTLDRTDLVDVAWMIGNSAKFSTSVRLTRSAFRQCSSSGTGPLLSSRRRRSCSARPEPGRVRSRSATERGSVTVPAGDDTGGGATRSRGGGAPADPRRWWVLVVLCLALVVVGIDGTIVNVALPTLVRELGATSSELQWIVDAYTIVFAGFLLIAGNTGDRLGRKRAPHRRPGRSSASGRSPAGASTRRAGDRHAGGAGLRRRVHHAGDPVDPHQRLRRCRGALARPSRIWAGVSGLGVAIGPLVGGWLLEHFWWGSIFLVNVPS